LPNFNAGQVRAWNRASLQADRSNAPDVVLTLPATSRPNAVTFDATGNLWVTDNFNARLLKYGRAQIQGTGQPVPQVVIDTDGTSLQNVVGFAFDRLDNLWVAAVGRLEMYVPTNLDDSGPTTPNRVIGAAGIVVSAEITFDAAGNLWMTSASDVPANNSVVAFTPAQQAAGGVQVPALRLRSTAFALVEGLRFDASGSLWVASNDGLNIARFAAAAVAVPANAETRDVVPVASLESDADGTAAGRTVRKAGGIVFDRDGNLFVNSERGDAGGTESGLLQFAASQLAFSGPQQVKARVLVAGSTSNPGFGGMALELP
jgi:ligand-binding sensor domain-containing protein